LRSISNNLRNSNNNNNNGITRFATLLPEQSDEFLAVDYKLQLALNTTLIDGLKIWTLANPNLSVKFDKKTDGLLVLDSWVPTSVLKGENSLESICERGFAFQNEKYGYPFNVGSFKMDAINNRNSTYITCVLCSVAVGASLVASSLDEAKQILKSRLFPIECDSLYIENEQNDVYTNIYRMFDSSQVLPRYIVRFSSSSFINQRSLRQDRSPSLKEGKHFVPYGTNPIIDPILQDTIKSQIARIDELLRKPEDEKVEDLIYNIAEDSVIHLEKIAQEKMDILISEQMTIRSQLDRLEEYENYISEQFSDLTPIQFLGACNGVNAILSTPANFARTVPPSLDTVVADIVLEGQIKVIDQFNTAGPGGGNGILNAVRSTNNCHGLFNMDNYHKSPKNSNGSATYRYDTNIQQSSFFRGVIFDENLQKLESFYREDPSATIKLPPRSARHIYTIKQQIERERFNIPSDLGDDVPKEFVPPSNHSQNGESEYNVDSNINMDKQNDNKEVEPVALPTDQSLFQEKLDHYEITPKALDTYQIKDHLHQHSNKSAGLAIIDILWANNMKGDEIVVEDEEDDNDEAKEMEAKSHTSADISDVASKKSPQKSQLLPEAARVLKPYETSAIYRRCQIVAKRFKRFRLSVESRRRRRRHQARDPGQLPREQVFLRSEILPDDQHEDLFWSIPTVGDDLYPSIKYVGRVYGGRQHIVNVHALFRDADCQASLIICRSGNYVFGAYASSVMPDDGTYSGDSTSFIFSVTHGLKIPYHGRIVPEGWRKPHDNFSYGSDAIRGEEDLIQYGTGDLIISDNMQYCTSALENSYGFALPQDVQQTFLAGQSPFVIDTLEVYRVGRQYEDATILEFESPVKRRNSMLRATHFGGDDIDENIAEQSLSSDDSYTITNTRTDTTSTGSKKSGNKRNSIMNARLSVVNTDETESFQSMEDNEELEENTFVSPPPPPQIATNDNVDKNLLPPPPSDNVAALPPPRFSTSNFKAEPPPFDHTEQNLGPPPLSFEAPPPPPPDVAYG
jgi:hypothetical protein